MVAEMEPKALLHENIQRRDTFMTTERGKSDALETYLDRLVDQVIMDRDTALNDARWDASTAS